ncbi:MAG: metallohydrolase [Alphaproteobacteria bacterium]|nr:metallohydrolase [Alphaproteobacteria bacterium]
MVARISVFVVGNGDMALIELESGRKILIDTNIRSAADDPDDDTPDVAAELRNRLTRDPQGRLYVDALLVSHPDQDHCRGLRRHFHLGPPGEWSKTADKIFIRELWSSPMVFRRASSQHVLCDDAKAFNTEARRRVARFREIGGSVGEGDRILILGEDENGKTDDLTAILIKTDDTFSRVNGEYDYSMTTRLLAPRPKSDDDDEEERRSKNHSSTILRFSLLGGGKADAGRFLTGGDAEVAIWERLWNDHEVNADWLSYDILLVPHHCSWHSLSYDSWSELGEDAEVSPEARKALSQTRKGAVIVASSNPIKDDDNDPPCIRAKREYEDIAKDASGSFKCVGEYPTEKNPETMEFEIGADGPRLKSKSMKATAIIGAGSVGSQPLGHG